MWIASAILNQVILARLAYKMLKENGSFRVNGMIFLMVWGVILGPMFTTLCGFIWWIERE